MKKILTILLLCISTCAICQNFFTSFYAGFANYQGDLQQTPFNPLTFRPSFGAGFLYEINNKLLFRVDFTNGKLTADDKYSIKNRSRNLSFSTNLNEFSLGLEYLFLDLNHYMVSPYVFAQAGIFKFSPYIINRNGIKITLYELDTEGQGFYKDRKKYKLRQICLPLGFGTQWAINDNMRFGIVFGFRKTFTDYLDDVSTTYVDQILLITKRGSTAAEIAYRGDELPNGAQYPPEGTSRGNPANNDSYSFIGLTFRIRLDNSSRWYPKEPKPKKSSIKCPVIF